MIEIKSVDGRVLYTSQADTIRSAVTEAVRENANLWCAYLWCADLRGADLGGATLNWTSHTLLSEILWRAADTEPRRMLAAYVGRMTDWCWEMWQTWEHPERDWAAGVLSGWVKEGDGAPEWIRMRAPKVTGEGIAT